MDCTKLGLLIRRLRTEQGLTQCALAEKLNLSGKTVSKWERGLGCPDVNLLGQLSRILEVDLVQLLEGSLSPNRADSGNMKKTRWFVCPDCGSISMSSGGAVLSCCGRRLAALEMKKAAPEEQLHAEAVEDEWYITSDHPMEKDNYISFVAFQSGSRVELTRLYPEWNLQLRLKRRQHGMLVWYAKDTGLLYRLL